PFLSDFSRLVLNAPATATKDNGGKPSNVLRFRIFTPSSLRPGCVPVAFACSPVVFPIWFVVFPLQLAAGSLRVRFRFGADSETFAEGGTPSTGREPGMSPQASV